VGQTDTDQDARVGQTEVAVLLVDDDETWVKSTAELLETQREAFRIRTVTDLETAREAFARMDPDCVVCDYGLVSGTGLELLESVRERDAERPFVLITGQGSETVASDAIGQRVTDYIPKRSLGGRDDLLARRIESAVETYRTRQALARERRGKEAILDILTATSSRSGPAEQFCEHLVTERDYDCAWIGTAGRSREVIPRAVAGLEEYVDAVIGAGATPQPGGEPALDALASREPRLVDSIEGEDGWRATAAEFGFESSAAVPITHDGSTFGVVAVYRSGPTIDPVEQDILLEYGSAIGYAMRSAEWRESLLSAGPVVLDVELTDESVPLVAFDRHLPESARTRVLTTSLGSETALYVARVDGAEPSDVGTAAAEADGIADVEITREDDPLRCDLTASLPIPETVIADRGGRVVDATASGGRTTLSVVASDDTSVQPLIEAVRSAYSGVGVASVRWGDTRRGVIEDPLEALTDKQYRAIEMAYFSGYFERPRDHDTREVADKLGIARQTLTQHLRAGQRTLFDGLFDD